MRITIIGNCGSGKTTLANKISRKLSIPHIHLDRFWFEAGGHTLKKDDTNGKEKIRAYIRTKIEEAISSDSWVSDGWYSRMQPLIEEKADQVVFLDISLWRRLVNHIHRAIFNKIHQEVNYWDDFKFIFEIIRRTFTHGVPMKKFIQEHPEKVIHLRSYSEADEYLSKLSTE